MGDLFLEYRCIFRDSLLKVLSAENIGEKSMVDDEIEHFGISCFLVPILPFLVILINVLFQFLQRCIPLCLELLSIEESVLLDAHRRIKEVWIAASL